MNLSQQRKAAGLPWSIRPQARLAVVTVDGTVGTVLPEIVRIQREDHRSAEAVLLDPIRLALQTALVFVRDPLGAGVQIGRTAFHVVHLVHVDVVPPEPANLRIGRVPDHPGAAIAGGWRSDAGVERVHQLEAVPVRGQPDDDLALLQTLRHPVVDGSVDVQGAEERDLALPSEERRVETCGGWKR